MKHLHESGDEVFICAFRLDLQPHLKVKLPFLGSVEGQRLSMALKKSLKYASKPPCILKH